MVSNSEMVQELLLFHVCSWPWLGWFGLVWFALISIGGRVDVKLHFPGPQSVFCVPPCVC